VIDDQGLPTILACGLGPADPAATPAADVAALIGLVARAVGAEPPTATGLVTALADHLSPPEKAAVRMLASPASGEELYSFADALEIAILKAELRRQRAP
jgi:hypothetical protein